MSPSPERRWPKRTVGVVFGLVAALIVCEMPVRVAGAGGASVPRGTLHACDPAAWRICLPGADGGPTSAAGSRPSR